MDSKSTAILKYQNIWYWQHSFDNHGTFPCWYNFAFTGVIGYTVTSWQHLYPRALSLWSKMKRGQDIRLSIDLCSYVAEKPCGCLYKLTCYNAKFHSLFKCKLYLWINFIYHSKVLEWKFLWLFSILITKIKKRSLNVKFFLENFLHTLDMCLLCFWLVIQTATRCSTVLLITWLIGSCTS